MLERLDPIRRRAGSLSTSRGPTPQDIIKQLAELQRQNLLRQRYEAVQKSSERTQEMQEQVVDPAATASKELGLPPGGTLAVQPLAVDSKKGSWVKRQGKKAFKAVVDGVVDMQNRIALTATEKLPWMDKTFAEQRLEDGALGTDPLISGVADHLALLGQQLKKDGITHSDLHPGTKENPLRNQYYDPQDDAYYKIDEQGNKTKELTGLEKARASYNRAETGYFENVNDALEVMLNIAGMDSDYTFKQNMSNLALPFSGDSTQARINLASATQAKLKGEPVPENFTRIPEMPRKLAGEFFFDPLNILEIGIMGKAALGGRKIMNIGSITDEVVATSSKDGKYVGRVMLDADEANEVISYETIRKHVREDLIPVRAGIYLGDSKQLGYSRQELINLRNTLEEQVIKGKYYDQPEVRKKLSKGKYKVKSAEEAPFAHVINGNLLDVKQSEDMLKQLNNLLLDDKVIRNRLKSVEVIGKTKGTKYGEIVDPYSGEKIKMGVIRESGRKGSKTIDVDAANWHNPATYDDILNASEEVFIKDPTGIFDTRLTKIAKSIPVPTVLREGADNVFSFFQDMVSRRLNLPSADIFRRTVGLKGRYTDPDEYIEASLMVHLQNSRSIPDLIELSPGFIELKRMGSPLKYDSNRGVSVINDLPITKKLLDDRKIKYVLDEDNNPVIQTSDFISKFFTTEGDQQYWRLIAPTFAEAKAHLTGQWVTKFQRIITSRADDAFAKGTLDKVINPKAVKGEVYIPRIPVAIQKGNQLINISARDFNPNIARGYDDFGAAKAVADEDIRYTHDPYDIVRVFGEKTYQDGFDADLVIRTRGVSPKKIVDPRIVLNDIVSSLDASVASRASGKDISNLKAGEYNNLIDLFPEITEDLARVERLTGPERKLGYQNIQAQIKKLKSGAQTTIKDTYESSYLSRLRHIEATQKAIEESQGAFQSMGAKLADPKRREDIFKVVFASKSKKLDKRVAQQLREDSSEFDSAMFTWIKEFKIPGRETKVGKATIDLGEWSLNLTERTSNAIKGVIANFDFAAPMIQGLFVLMRDPKAWAEGTKVMVDSLADEKVFYEFISKHQDTVRKLIKGGVPLGTRTSDIFYATQRGGRDAIGSTGVSKLLNYLPIFRNSDGVVKGRKVKAGWDWTMNKASGLYSHPLDAFKILTFEGLEPLVQSADDVTGLLSYIRHSTGSMDTAAMGIGQTQRSIENAFLFFSSRLTRGMAALTMDTFRGGLRGDQAREAWAKLAMGNIIIGKQLADVTGGELDLDISSGSFGSVRMKNGDVVGFSQTLLAPMKALIDTVEITAQDPGAWFQSDFWKVGAIRYDDKFLVNPITRIGRSKSGVFGQRGWEFFTGVDYMGQPTTTEGMIRDTLPIPFSIQSGYIDDFNRATRDPDWSLPIIGEVDFYWLQWVDLLGIKQFPQDNWTGLERTRNEITGRRFPKNKQGLPATWNDLSPVQKNALLNPPSLSLEGKTEAEIKQIESDAATLKNWEDMVYNKYKSEDMTLPDAVNDYWVNRNEVKKKFRKELDDLTKTLENGELAKDPGVSSMRVFKSERRAILNKMYDEIGDPSLEVQEYFDEQALSRPENSIKFLLDKYSRDVWFNPEFDLPNNEFDWDAMQKADKNFLENDLHGNKTLYDQIMAINYTKRDLNEYEAELVIGQHIFGGHYFTKVEEATLEQFPDVENIFKNVYKDASREYQDALRATNPRLAEFITVKNKVRRLELEKDPLLDAWAYRNGYTDKLHHKIWRLENGGIDYDQLYLWRDPSMPIDWSMKWNQRKQEFPEYY